MTDLGRELSVEQRVERLERVVKHLAERLGATSASDLVTEASAASSRDVEHPPRRPRPFKEEQDPGPDVSASGPREGQRERFFIPPHEGAAGARRPPRAEKDLAATGEVWLGRVGVGFVILAFGFLFRYAFDQGWIGPALRLLLGLVAGGVMLVVGLRLEGTRERYSQYLLGGSIGLFYLVTFAAYQLYALIPFAVAFALMAAVTVLAFVLSERQRLASLAVIGATGGLLTPFLLSTGSGNVPGLVVYTLVLLAGAGTVQFWRGWRSLLVVLGFGGFAVMAVGVAAAVGLETLIVLLGVVAVWVAFGALPPIRAHLHRLQPDAWPEPPLSGKDKAAPEWVGLWLLRVACISGGFLAAMEIAILFSLGDGGAAAVFALGSVIYAVFAWKLRETRPSLNAAAETASILLALAIVIVLQDDRSFLPLAIAAASMHVAGGRWELGGVSFLGHALFVSLALWFLSRLSLIGGFVGSPFGVVELTILGSIIMAFATSFELPREGARTAYRITAHVGLLTWLAYQFLPMDLGQELISLTWGIYGVVLLLLSFRLDHRGVQLAGLTTLGLVAGKLLLVDMAQVDVIWRILLFMGFGIAFLGLSYLIKRHSPAT